MARSGASPIPASRYRRSKIKVPAGTVGWNRCPDEALFQNSQGWRFAMISNIGDAFPHRMLDLQSPPPRSEARKTATPKTTDGLATQSGAIIETDIPARLDALPFGRFHILVIVALGITWILDGLEVTLAGALSGELKRSSALGFSNAKSAWPEAAIWPARCSGRSFRLADGSARPQKLFTITLVVYLARDRRDRAVMEFLELRVVPHAHRRRHRRRIHRHQFDNPGAYPGPRCAAGPICRSTAASGSAPRLGAGGSTRLARPRTSSTRRSAGALHS